jgi:hypothetical protein
MDGRAATATAFSISAAISGKDTVRASLRPSETIG